MSAPNRLLSPGADGSFTLRQGRLYRLLLVVNGSPPTGELADALCKLGFAGHDLALSTSAQEWAEEQPPDWPAEALPAIAANERLVRASGSFLGARMHVRRDTPIAGGGTLTIAQAWDYGPALDPAEERTGGTPPVDDRRSSVLVCGVLAVTGIAAWSFMRSGRRLEREEERFNALEMRAERARVGARIRALMSEGYPPGDAEAIATSESILSSQQQSALEPAPAASE